MDPIFVPPDEGETLSDSPERFVQIKADLPQIALTSNRYAPGESGPDPHVHHEHADCFWVLDGELLFELGGDGDRVELGAGAFVAVPPNVVHTFRNEGSADARFLNIHVPNAGFADHLRALHRAQSEEEKRAASERFDTADPPPDGGRPAADALVSPPERGDVLEMGLNRLVFKAEVADADGMLSLTDSSIVPGFPGPILHRHERTLDSFYVLDGTLTLRLGERTVEAAPGTYVVAPPGAAHTFSNPGEETARFLNLMAPGGFEQYLKEVAATIRPGEPPDPAVMAQIASKYDFHPVL